MRLSDAVIKSLEVLGSADNPRLADHNAVYNVIKEQNYELDIPDEQFTPQRVSTTLGRFHTENSQQVSRIANPERNGRNDARFLYYLTEYEQKFSEIFQPSVSEPEINLTLNGATYYEKDLHILLATYISPSKIFAKTIPHNQSSRTTDSTQTWTHPDMVGIKFTQFKSDNVNKLMGEVNKSNSFQIYSYELKKEINSDYELKQAYFQAVSNSSWANYGYLVAFQINDNLKKELERLNQSFGIGCIELNSNPYNSKVLHHAKLKDLDFLTIDKLCDQNEVFQKFIENVHAVVSATNTAHYAASIGTIETNKDKILGSTDEIIDYLGQKNIPYTIAMFPE